MVSDLTKLQHVLEDRGKDLLGLVLSYTSLYPIILRRWIKCYLPPKLPVLCHKYNISTTTFSSQVWIEPTQNWRSDKQKGKQTAFLIRICILTFWICIASLLCVIYQSVTTLGSINIFYFFLLMICLKAFIYKILWTINFFFVCLFNFI